MAKMITTTPRLYAVILTLNSVHAQRKSTCADINFHSYLKSPHNVATLCEYVHVCAFLSHKERNTYLNTIMFTYNFCDD